MFQVDYSVYGFSFNDHEEFHGFMTTEELRVNWITERHADTIISLIGKERYFHNWEARGGWSFISANRV